MTARNYAILYIGKGGTALGGSAGGGSIPLSTEQHALDGHEHTPATTATRLLSTVDHAGLLRELSGDPADAFRGDGTWRPVRTPAFYEGALSKPPTESELESILGAPVALEGQIVPLGDTASGTVKYFVGSDGALWYLIPIVRPIDDTGGADTILALTSAPEGGWVWFMDPRAVNDGTYTYVGYIDGAGNIKIVAITGGAVAATFTLHAALQVDDHDDPSIFVRPSDGRLRVFYSKHSGPNIYTRKSTNPADISAWGAETSLSAGFGASVSTYPVPAYNSNIDGAGARLVLFWRETVAGVQHWWYAASSDDGDTWTGHVDLHTLTYSKVCDNGVDEIHLAVSKHPASPGNADKIYHLYRSAAAWRQTDGTDMGAGFPFDGSDMTEVWDGSGAGDLCWVHDIALDGSGNPVIAFVRYPGGDDTDHRYMYALWDGAAWQVNEIAAAGSTIVDDLSDDANQVYYSGGITLDPADPQIVYCSRQVSGQWEIFRYVTANGGVSFTPTQLTSGSTSKNLRPAAVRDADDIAVVWLTGTYTDYLSWSQGIKGLAP